MLNEVGANHAVMDSLPKAAKSVVRVWKYRLISLLNDQSIEKTKAARDRAQVRLIAAFIRDSQCGGDASQQGGPAIEIGGGLVRIDARQAQEFTEYVERLAR